MPCLRCSTIRIDPVRHCHDLLLSPLQMAAATLDFLASYADTVRSSLRERMAWLGALHEDQRRRAGADDDLALPLVALDCAPAPAGRTGAAAAADGEALLAEHHHHHPDSSAAVDLYRSGTPAIDQEDFCLVGPPCAASEQECGALFSERDEGDALGALLESYTDELLAPAMDLPRGGATAAGGRCDF